MALLKFISLSVGSLMLFQGAYASGETEYESSGQADPACADAMNAARKAAGLDELVKPEPNSLETAATTLGDLCKELGKENGDIITQLVQKDSTRAVAKGAASCDEAIKLWKAGFSKFSSYTSDVPPVYKAATAPYNSVEAVSFTALYAGLDTLAKAECINLTCTPQGDSARSTGMFKAVLCQSIPASLKTDATAGPWSKEQWDKVKNHLNPPSSTPSSATAAVPTLLALAAAAVGVALI